MRKSVVTLACALAIAMGAVQAEATTLAYGDSDFLGAVIPGVPPNDANQEAFITVLIGLAPGASQNCTVNPGPELCTRSNSTVAGPFPSPVAFEFKVEGGVSNINDVGGFQYVLAKYGGGMTSGATYVWYVAGGTDANVIVPTSSLAAHGSLALSHVSFFNATSVPDGGTTLALLGAGLVGLGALRRKFAF